MSISTIFQEALKKHGKLVLELDEHASLLSPTLQAHSADIKNEYGRLRIWGEQTRAVLPEKARHSLDEQLRDNEETRNIILRTLRRLTNHLDTATDQAELLHTTPSQYPDQLAHFSDYEDDSSSDESLSTQSFVLAASRPRLRKAIESVIDSIRSLYRISTLLKRPRNANKYLRSRNMKIPSQAVLSAEEDYSHILEKMRQWRRLTMRSQVGGDEETAVTLDEILRRKRNEDHELADITFLCQRLTWANKLRRNQFKYWEESPDVPETQEEVLMSQPDPNRAEARNLSATQTSFSSVAVSALAETRTEAGRLRTEYTSSVIGRSNAIRVPDVPECSKTDPDFECPFCHLTLSSGRMQERRAWKRHVFRDLRPYVCSFESCMDPGKLFITRHDWIYHEQQMHRRKWICPDSCAQNFYSKRAMSHHLQSHHSDNLSIHQISTYADMCEREIDATESGKCLVCLEKMSLSRLQNHLATHMEEIALFVLPTQDNEDSREYRDKSSIISEDFPEPMSGEDVALQDFVIATDHVKAQELSNEVAQRKDKTSLSSEAASAHRILGDIKGITTTGRRRRGTKGEREHGCIFCGKVYSRREHLKRHQRKHKIGQYPCTSPLCESTFHTPELLEHHRRHDWSFPFQLPEQYLYRCPSGGPGSAALSDFLDPGPIREWPERQIQEVLGAKHDGIVLSPRKSELQRATGYKTTVSGAVDQNEVTEFTSEDLLFEPDSPETSTDVENEDKTRVGIEKSGLEEVDETIGTDRGRKIVRHGVSSSAAAGDNKAVQLEPTPYRQGEELDTSFEPPVYRKDSEPVKSILKNPTPQFPEDPNPVREGVAPLRDGSEVIPPEARWTKIDRHLVSPEALEKAQERFEQYTDHVIVLRVLTKDEIQKLADSTSYIRAWPYSDEQGHEERGNEEFPHVMEVNARLRALEISHVSDSNQTSDADTSLSPPASNTRSSSMVAKEGPTSSAGEDEPFGLTRG